MKPIFFLYATAPLRNAAMLSSSSLRPSKHAHLHCTALTAAVISCTIAVKLSRHP